MLEIFQYGFIVRGLTAGLIVAVIAPLIGLFLVLRRYALIADTLAHVSLAGVALGLVLQLNPLVTALLSAVGASVLIERLRMSKAVYGESALAIFLSGSLALAILLISFGRGLSVDLFNYLFGSIVTVKPTDVWTMAVMGVVVLVTVGLFYKELVFLAFDEVAAQVAGIPVRLINTILILLTAVTVALAIPIVGVLLISALMVIPVVAALQLKQGFTPTLVIAEIISVFSVVAGIFSSFYLNLAAGSTIVLIALGIFLVILLCRHMRERFLRRK